MITYDMLEEYELGSIEEYFDYIISHRVGGKHQKARELFSRMSEDQKERFCVYAEDMGLDEQIGSHSIPLREYFGHE